MRYYYSFFGGCSDSWRRSRVKSDSFSIEFKDENTWNSLFSLQINDVHTYYLASSFLSASLIVFSRKKNFEITRIIFDLNWIEWIVNWFELIEEISKYFQKTDPADWKLIALAPQLYKYWCSQLTHHTHFVLNSE